MDFLIRAPYPFGYISRCPAGKFNLQFKSIFFDHTEILLENFVKIIVRRELEFSFGEFNLFNPVNGQKRIKFGLAIWFAWGSCQMGMNIDGVLVGKNFKRFDVKILGPDRHNGLVNDFANAPVIHGFD